MSTPRHKPNTERILVIGDTHAPFTHERYLEHCKQVAKFYKTTHTIHIGDELDGHASSFHDSNPDGMSAGDELEHTINMLGKWHKAFPNADVIIGNHTAIVARKLYSAGISKRWMRSLEEVLNVPTWNYSLKRVYDDVLYIHGQGVTARTKALRTGMSVVQGHRHTEGYVWYHATEGKTLFGMQVGTGIDQDSYAFEYAKDHPPPVLSCGVVINGKRAFLEPMLS